MAISKATVTSAPTYTGDVRYGQSLTLTAGNVSPAESGKHIGYQWQFKGKGDADFANLPGKTEQTLVLDNMDFTKEGNYRVGVRLELDTPDSNVPDEEYNFKSGSDKKIVIGFDPITVAATTTTPEQWLGGAVTFTSTVSGNPTGTTLEYKWHKKTGTRKTFVADNNQTTDTLAIAELLSGDVGGYKISARIVTPDNRLSWTQSDEATVALKQWEVKPTNQRGTANITADKGEYGTQTKISADIDSSTVTSPFTLEYMWQFKAKNTQAWVDLSQTPLQHAELTLPPQFTQAYVGEYRMGTRVIPTGWAAEKERSEYTYADDALTLGINYPDLPNTITSDIRDGGRLAPHNAPVVFTATPTDKIEDVDAEYQWQFKAKTGGDFADVSNATEATYTIPQFKTANEGEYRCKTRYVSEDNSETWAESAAIDLTVRLAKVEVTMNAPAEEVSRGQNTTVTALTITQPDGFNYEYKWQYQKPDTTDWIDLATTTRQHVINNFQSEHAGKYRAACRQIATDIVHADKEEDQFEFGDSVQELRVKRGTVSVTSGTDTNSLTVEHRQQAALAVNVVVTEGETYTTQWQKRSKTDTTQWEDISGADQALYTYNVIELDDEGTFRCKVTPTDTNIPEIISSEFTVSLARHVITFVRNDQEDQFVKKGAAIALGVSATVDHSGETVTYQWQKQQANGTWEDIQLVEDSITQTTMPRIQFMNADVAMDGRYRVAGKTGNPATPVAYSSEYNLKVTPSSIAVAINAEEEEIFVASSPKENPTGSTLTIGTTIKTDIPGDVDYQWQISTDGTNFFDLTDNNRVSGTRSETLVISSAESSDEKYYRVMATTRHIQIHTYSQVIYIAVQDDPTPTLTNVQITHQNGETGKTHLGAFHAIQSTQTTNRTDLLRTWEFKAEGQETWVALKGKTEERLVIDNVNKTHAGKYRLKVQAHRVENIYVLTEFSNELDLIVNEAPSVTFVTPTTVVEKVAEEKNVQLVASYTVESGTVERVQWMKNGEVFTPDGSKGQTLSSDNTILTFSSLEVEDAGQYRLQVILRESDDAFTGQAIRLTVEPSMQSKFPDVARAHSESQTIDANNSFSMGVTATQSYLYEWYKNGVRLEDYTTAVMTIAVADPSDTATYKLKVSKPDVPEMFIEYFFNITVNEGSDEIPPFTPGDQVNLDRTNLGIIRENDAVVIQATVTGNPESYQWYHVKDNRHLEIPGQTTNRLALTFTPDIGSVLYLKVKYRNQTTDVVTEVNSDNVVVSEFIPVELTLDFDATLRSLNEGEILTLTVNAHPNDEYLSVKWVHTDIIGNESPILGSTTSTLTISPLQVSDAGKYHAVVTRLGRSVITPKATVNIKAREQIKHFTATFDQYANIRRPEGSTFTLVANVVGDVTDSTLFHWYKKVGTADAVLVEGQETTTLTIRDLSESDVGHYYLEIIDGLSNYRSNAVHLDVVRLSDIEAPEDDSHTPGDNMSETESTHVDKTPEKQARTIVANYVKVFEERVRVGKKVTPQERIGAHIEFFHDILRVLQEADKELYHAKMDELVDLFYLHRDGIFAMTHRFNGLGLIGPHQLTTTQIEGYQELIDAFVYMADPAEGVPTKMRRLEDVLPDTKTKAKVVARFNHYYQLKVRTQLTATTEPSTQV